MRAGVLVLLLTLIYCAVSNAQNGEVLGKVTDTKGSPIAQVNVRMLNTSFQTQTDSNGFFKLPTGKNTNRILFSHIGYADVVVSYSSAHLNVVLDKSSNQLTEVVVSADYREKELLKTPASITLLSADKVHKMRVWSVDDLSGVIPNFNYAELGVGYQQQVAIRGISIFSETPATATYVDGVAAIDVSATGLQWLDIDKIEVLRGPQSTLYGRNAMGGVINITTKKPDASTSGFSEVSLGNLGLQRYNLGVKTPLISDKLLLGVSGQYQKQNGFYFNDLSESFSFTGKSLKGTPEDGKRVGDNESVFARLNLEYITKPNLRFSWNAVYQEEHSIGASSYYMAAETDKIALERPYRFSVNDLGSHQRKFFSTALSGWLYRPAFTLTSAISFQNIQQAYHNVDQDLYPYDLATGSSFRKKLGDAYPQNVWSQEVRIQSNTNKRFQYTAGSYFFYQDLDKQFAAVYNQLGLFFGVKPGTQISRTHFRNSGVAVFGQSEFEFAKKWKVIGGIRIDHERRDTRVARYYMETDVYDVPDTNMTAAFSAVSPKMVFQYLPKQNNQVYLSYSRGFRAGGNNLFLRGKYLSYDPELSENFELGYKTRLWQKRLSVSATAFVLYWKNMQLDMQPEPGYWIIDNVGNVISMGAETELSIIPFPGSQVDGSLGVNWAEYGSFDYLDVNIGGNTAIMAPSYTSMLGFEQLLPVTRRILGSVRLEWRGFGKQYFDLINTIVQPAYNLFNFRSGLHHKKTELAFWIQNLSDNRHLTFAMPGYFKQSIINKPRSWGFTLKQNF